MRRSAQSREIRHLLSSTVIGTFGPWTIAACTRKPPISRCCPDVTLLVCILTIRLMLEAGLHHALMSLHEQIARLPVDALNVSSLMFFRIENGNQIISDRRKRH